MKNWKSLLLVCAIVLLIISGCSTLMDNWPVRKSKMARDYIGQDSSGTSITTIAKEKEVMAEVIHKHILTQLELRHLISVDKADHDAAMEIDNNITIAEAERESMVGSIEKPGWLLGALISVTGIGTYIAGRRTQRPEDYNEAEMEIEVAKRVAVELAKANKG